MQASDFNSYVALESLEILTQAGNFCNDVLSYEILHIWFNMFGVTGGLSED